MSAGVQAVPVGAGARGGGAAQAAVCAARARPAGAGARGRPCRRQAARQARPAQWRGPLIQRPSQITLGVGSFEIFGRRGRCLERQWEASGFSAVHACSAAAKTSAELNTHMLMRQFRSDGMIETMHDPWPNLQTSAVLFHAQRSRVGCALIVFKRIPHFG